MTNRSALHWSLVALTIAICCASCQSFATPTSGPSPIPLPTKHVQPPKTATLLSSTILPSSTLTPSPAPKTIDLAKDYNLALRMSYITADRDLQNNPIDTKLWVWEPTLPEPRVVFSTTQMPGTFIMPKYAWSHNGQTLAFVRLDPDNTISVHALDLASGKTERLSQAISHDDYSIDLNSSSWSADDRWLSVSFLANGATTSGIVDIQSGALNFLDYQTQEVLLAWSPITADQYVKLAWPNYAEGADPIPSIGMVAASETVEIPGYTPSLGALVQFAWSPDGERAIIEVAPHNGRLNIIRLALRDESPRVVLLSSFDLRLIPCWSPDGRWVVVQAYDGTLSFLSTEAPNTIIAIKAPAGVEPIGWLPDSSRLLLHNGAMIYAVAPLDGDSLILVSDFSNLLKEGAYSLGIVPVSATNGK